MRSMPAGALSGCSFFITSAGVGETCQPQGLQRSAHLACASSPHGWRQSAAANRPGRRSGGSLQPPRWLSASVPQPLVRQPVSADRARAVEAVPLYAARMTSDAQVCSHRQMLLLRRRRDAARTEEAVSGGAEGRSPALVPIRHRQRDEDGQLNDLTACFLADYGQSPAGAHDDLLDAVSRFIDLKPTRPVVGPRDDTEPQVYWDRQMKRREKDRPGEGWKIHSSHSFRSACCPLPTGGQQRLPLLLRLGR
jgi:hypothetical protein